MTPLIQKLRSAGEAERTLAPASGLFDEAADEIERLTAALAEREWRPIETLDVEPQERFDVWCDGERLENCWLHDEQVMFYDGASGYADIVAPTHWMRAPDGPETQPGERGE